MSLALAVMLIVAGLVTVSAATHDRRRRWRHARPYAGDERAAPEPALVPNTRVYLVYVGWILVAVGALTAAAVD